MKDSGSIPKLVTAGGRPARVALVHEWFDHFYGSERVAAEILACFPTADVFTLVDIMSADERGVSRWQNVKTSFIQRLPFGSRRVFATICRCSRWRSSSSISATTTWCSPAAMPSPRAS